MWIRRLAACAAVLTVVLIVAGGLVTNTDSGLACPDWPLCYGSPMPAMIGGVAVEHTHRLLATAAGLCTVLLCLAILPWRRSILLCGIFAPLFLGGAFRAAHVFQTTGALSPFATALVVAGLSGCAAILVRTRGEGRIAVLALGFVLVQGLLGGLTVIFRLPPAVLVLHTATSMLFLATLTALALRLRGASASMPRTSLLWVTLAAVYVQIVLGAAVRHTGAGLVCVDLPYCRGALWPTGVHPSVHLHMAHRAFALVVLALVCWNGARLARGQSWAVRALALGGPALAGLQVLLGALTILTLKDIVPLTAHLFVAALLLVDLVSLAVLARGVAEPATAEAQPFGAIA